MRRPWRVDLQLSFPVPRWLVWVLLVAVVALNVVLATNVHF